MINVVRGQTVSERQSVIQVLYWQQLIIYVCNYWNIYNTCRVFHHLGCERGKSQLGNFNFRGTVVFDSLESYPDNWDLQTHGSECLAFLYLALSHFKYLMCQPSRTTMKWYDCSPDVTASSFHVENLLKSCAVFTKR